MRRVLQTGFTAWLILAGGGDTQAQQIFLSREFSITAAEALGAEIYRQDVASAIGSDLLLAEVPDPEEAGVLGWVTTADANGTLVAFVGLVKGEFVSLYDARPNEPAQNAFRSAGERRLSELELTLFLARMTAMRHAGALCSVRYNVVTLPDPESDSWLVYLLAVTDDAAVVPVGGHYRITVSPDGTEILAAEPLFVTCQAVNIAELLQNDPGEPIEVRIVQEVGKVPLETDVFLNLLIGLDLMIETPSNGNEWKLQEGSILASGAADILL
jgi:hypothetical protein